MRVAIVHDWLTSIGGAERVLEAMLEVFPDADLFSLIDFMKKEDRIFLKGKKTKTSFIQKMPLSKKYYRHYLPLMPIAVEQIDVGGYDLVISSSHAVAKGVITGPDQLHICMCYSPIRYAWDLQHQYLKESNLKSGPMGVLAKYILHRMRVWDARTANGVDHFIAISQFIARRIEKIYRRPSTVIYPPVNIEEFHLEEKKADYYVTASRLVPYKKVDLIVDAFGKMADKQLIVIGNGPEFGKLVAKGYPNVQFMGFQPHTVLREKMQKAKAFVFAAKEDFGIAPLEAAACGTPVICFGEGGLLETAVDGVTGCFFYEQSVESLCDAVHRFETLRFDPIECRKNAQRFSKERFIQEFKEFVRESVNLSRR